MRLFVRRNAACRTWRVPSQPRVPKLRAKPDTGETMRRLMLLAGLVFLAAAGPAGAQDYPNRPIRFVVPYPPGGSVDPVARILGADIAERLKQPVVVENKAGAAGSIGTDIVAKSSADGYTVLIHTSVLVTEPALKKTPYDLTRDLTPVTLAANGPYLLVVNPSLPVTSVKDLIAYAKANPGKLSFGSAGVASSGHMIGEMFKVATGIDMLHVPYRGGAPSIIGLMGNEVQLVFDVISTSKAPSEAGKLRALAVTSPERAPIMPDTPTVMESGLPDFSVVFWIGAFVPAGTPQPVVDRLYRAFTEALADPTVAEKLRGLGLQIRATPPADSAKAVAADLVRWRKAIEGAGIKAE
jgi:tripartite-type tricarboxylate transporter receptor subunit TctC